MKVLIISHNPMSTRHSIGKTLLSLFSEFQKEELCQLYIHTGAPERDVCSSFYRVTDKDALKGVLTRRVKSGTVKPQIASASSDTGAFYKSTYGSAKNRQPHREILRDLMWKMSPWYNKSLKSWLDEQKPTCIFAAIGSGTFLYDMAVKISRDYNIPLIPYVCDDFYSMAKPKTALGGMWKRAIVKKTKRLFKASSGMVSICDELSELYHNEFGISAHTVMTGTNFVVADAPVVKDGLNTLRYFGKLTLNRYKSMAEICRVIDRINKDENKNYTVEIYSDNPTDEMKKEFENVSSAKFCGFVSGDKFCEKFFSSDALIHVEAFDSQSIDRVKNSVSTKIADSLASGIPLLAYGPRNIASISHLVRNNCSFVAVSSDELEGVIKDLLDSRERRLEIPQNQLLTASRYHDSKKNSEMIREKLIEVCKK